MAGFIDKAAEIARLEKEIAKLQKDLQVIAGKLSNPNFVNKAPAEVVAKEQILQHDLQCTLSKLHEKLGLIRNL